MKQKVSLQLRGGQIANEVPWDQNSNEINPYEKHVFTDIQEMLSDRQTFDEHHDKVISTSGNTYKGMNKYVYGYIIKALQTIIESKKKRLGKSSRRQEVAFLHQDVGFAPDLIRNILRLFNVKLSIPQVHCCIMTASRQQIRQSRPFHLLIRKIQELTSGASEPPEITPSTLEARTYRRQLP